LYFLLDTLLELLENICRRVDNVSRQRGDELDKTVLQTSELLRFIVRTSVDGLCGLVGLSKYASVDSGSEWHVQLDREGKIPKKLNSSKLSV
jgi:hypothetical protein